MATRLIIEGNSVYEIDEDCEKIRGGNQVRNRSQMENAGNLRRQNGSNRTSERKTSRK